MNFSEWRIAWRSGAIWRCWARCSNWAEGSSSTLPSKALTKLETLKFSFCKKKKRLTRYLLQTRGAVGRKAFHWWDKEENQLHSTHQNVPAVHQVLSSIQLLLLAWYLLRYMQTVCCHSKLTASVSLANHVPLVKKALEVFVYRWSKKKCLQFSG